MRAIKIVLSVLLLRLLSACGTPVPPEKANYVGVWQDSSMYLSITADGSVEYKHQQGSTTTSISGPLKAFNGDNFEVGIGFMSTTFVVGKPPYQQGHHWEMVVDNVTLTKTP